MKKVDIHVHSKGSEAVVRSNPFTKNLGIKESYISGEHQYQLAKRRGMDYVTLSDHNSISEARILVQNHPEDCFMSCEYLIKGKPDGQDLECLVLDIDEDLHKQLMQAKEYGAKTFMDCARQAKKPFALAHPGWPVNPTGPQIKIEELEEWVGLVDVIEGRNGDCQRENEISAIISKRTKKPMCGGSDDHSGLSTGLTYTVAPNATSKESFLSEFSKGNIYAEGEVGNIRKFYKEMLTIGKQFVKIEKSVRKSLGLIGYFRRDPRRFLQLMVYPHIMPCYLMVAARINKETFEMRSAKLERDYIEHIKKTRMEIVQKVIDNIEKKIDDEIGELEAVIKPSGNYIPNYTILEKIFAYLLNSRTDVHTDFDKFKF